MTARSFKAKALVFAIFFLGIGTGVLIANFYTTRVASAPDRTQRAQRNINKVYDYLGLNAEQREQMHKIGEETRREYQELRKETSPRFQALQEESRAKIRALLNEEQRKKYDKFRHDMDDRRKNRNRDDDRGPGFEGPGPRPD